MRKVAELLLVLVAVVSVSMGYFIGSSYQVTSEENQMPRLNCYVEDDNHTIKFYSALSPSPSQVFHTQNTTRINVATTPRGAESLPPSIVEPYSDFYLRRLQKNCSEDLMGKPKYLLALAVGYDQKDFVNEIIMKFSENFSILLFHYDGRISEWDQFEWSHRAIHISARKQSKWWYAKRFLHPNIVSSYDYIFIWDEDLGVDHFNAEEYVKLVKKHDLEISQPAVVQKKTNTWLMTKRKVGVEVHRKVEERRGKCHDKNQPPCAGFIEIMAPVFSRKSWQCVWHMIQNDLIHGWGLDFNLWRCAEGPSENIGVVDAQWVEHKNVPSLRDQGIANHGKPPGEGVWVRTHAEWREFVARLYKAELDMGSHRICKTNV